MDIEAIVRKHCTGPLGVIDEVKAAQYRAALTELVAGYEAEINALTTTAINNGHQAFLANERIRQLEAERVQDYTGGDAELLKQRDKYQFTAAVLEDAWCWSVPLPRPHFNRFLDACRDRLVAAPQQKKEGE